MKLIDKGRFRFERRISDVEGNEEVRRKT